MNLLFLRRHTKECMFKISSGFANTDCISKESWYVNGIDLNGNREDFVLILQANWAEIRRDT